VSSASQEGFASLKFGMTPAMRGVGGGTASRRLVLVSNTNAPFPAGGWGERLSVVRDGALSSVGVGDDQPGCARGLAGCRPGPLSWLRRVVGAVGLRARARGAAAAWQPPAAAASRALRAVSDHARVLPSWSVPRRRDAADVIGRALVLKADGAGHRTIADRLGRPPGTVRGWLRAAERRAGALADCGTLWTIALGEQTTRLRSGCSALQHALERLGSAALAWRLRFYEPDRCPWRVIVSLTGGGLLHGRPARPPGY
jgi:transposase-like protein